MLNRLREILATCLYVGHIPGAPGTYGSLAALSVFVILGCPLGAASWWALVGLVVISMFALSGLRETLGSDDPGPAVLDEAAGMWAAVLIAGSADWILLAITFASFRIFDSLKPFPINRLEKIPGWRGVLADDLAAGLAAGLVVNVLKVFVES